MIVADGGGVLTSVVVTVVVVLFLLAFVLRSVAKNAARFRGRNKCAFCGARLKWAPQQGGYAGVCRKCGRQQPWAH
jgi:hypothetical protein